MAYITLAEVKTELKIETLDTSRDTSLTRALNSACRQIDDSTGRTFSLAGSASARVLSPLGSVWCDDDGEHLLIPDVGSTSGLVVEQGSGSTYTALSSSSYELAPADAPGRGWPWTEVIMIGGAWSSGSGQRVRVTAKWGWPSVPDPIASAALIQTIRLWKRKDSPEGVLGSAEWGAIRVSRIDPDVAALIGPYRKVGF